MGGSRYHSEFFFLNHPKIPLNQYRYFGVVYDMYSVCIYILLKVVSYCDLSYEGVRLRGGGWGCKFQGGKSIT